MAFPEFFKYLQAFGQKDYARDEGFSGFNMSMSRNAAGEPTRIECCYMLKYVELHDDEEPTINPWTIRQVVIYQKFDLQSLESSHIFVRLSKAMAEELHDALQINKDRGRELVGRWDRIHILYLRTLNENWRQYINYLDEEVSKIFDQVILSNLDTDTSQGKSFMEGSLANVKRVQYLIDQTSRARHMLDLNSTVMKTMTRSSAEFPASATLSDIGPMLRDVIAMRNIEFMKTMTVSTVQGNGALLELSHKAVSEAQSMKAITIVALIYVPASFVADFLQMGYVSTAQQNGLVVSATKGLWVYAIITAPLVIVTMGIYFAYELLSRRSESRKNRTIPEQRFHIV
ncbi:hypothetical protein ABVK25_005425 [Lepraria finkii]|uniref:CorA-like transporter domain-containing protein n=1 Tax=Lepraria finkii TaxID=1340010 RepID=A0ABR4B8V2_9LECA